MTKTKQKSEESVSITFTSESASLRILKEVRTLLSFENMEQWEDKLQENGGRHKMYYHYTTLGALSGMLGDASWRITKVNTSNDPYEAPVYAVSFTTSSLSSTGMWMQYANWQDRDWGKASSIEKIGVRIGIPGKVFKKIFSNCDIYREKELTPQQTIEPSIPAVITDVAYWHFGSKPDGFNDMLFYRNYEFPFKTLGRYDETTLEMRTPKAVWQRPDPKDLRKPCFKQAIWRRENECRVYWDLGKIAPKAIYVRIPKEAFKNMTFILPPGFAYDAKSGCIEGKKKWYLNTLFSQVLEEKTIALSQFKDLSQQDIREDNDI